MDGWNWLCRAMIWGSERKLTVRYRGVTIVSVRWRDKYGAGAGRVRCDPWASSVILRGFLAAYKSAFREPHRKWVTGFPGFFEVVKIPISWKILSHLLQNKQVGDNCYRLLYRGSEDYRMGMVLAGYAAGGNTPIRDVILSTLIPKAILMAKENKDAIVNVFLEGIQWDGGLPAVLCHTLLTLERRLSEEGRFEEFKEKLLLKSMAIRGKAPRQGSPDFHSRTSVVDVPSDHGFPELTSCP